MSSVLGVCDSGLGGLTVLKEILKNNSYERIVFLGDTKRVPYGEKSKEEIFACAKSDIDFLMSKGVDEIVVACGTISSNCLNELKKIYNVNIYGIIDDVSELAVKVTQNKRIGVIATSATINSKAFEKSIKDSDSKCEVFSSACPEFVNIVESGNKDNEHLGKCLDLYLSKLSKENIDTLIFGCTHFPMLSKEINEYFGGKVRTLNSGAVLKDKLFNGTTKTPVIELYITGDKELFKANASKYIDIPELNNIEVVNLEE